MYLRIFRQHGTSGGMRTGTKPPLPGRHLILCRTVRQCPAPPLSPMWLRT